jgi:hypothetical protein
MPFKFSFKTSGSVGKATPEQQAVLDKLHAGELTPEEAAKQLGGHAHVFEFGAKPTTGEDEEESDPPEATVLPALANPRVVRQIHTFLAVFTAFLVVAVVLGNAAAHSHALTAGLFALLSLILFGGLTARVGLFRTPGGTILAAIPPIGAGFVLDWGLLVGVLHAWSIYYPGLILIGLTVCGVIAALFLGFAGKKARALEDDLSRRNHS